MSELTRCNHCNLKSIRARAKLDGLKVTLRAGWRGGKDVFVHPKSRPPDTSTDKVGNHGDDFVAWFMELTGACVC